MATATNPDLAPTRAVSLTINGEIRNLPSAGSLLDLIGVLRLDPGKVAIERNLAIVPRSLYGDTLFADGDRIEIVHFIGGG